VFAKVLAAVFELVANEADAVQVSPHGELFVFNLGLPGAGAFLGQCLVVYGQG
jgi:hypothetical protein